MLLEALLEVHKENSVPFSVADLSSTQLPQKKTDFPKVP